MSFFVFIFELAKYTGFPVRQKRRWLCILCWGYSPLSDLNTKKLKKPSPHVLTSLSRVVSRCEGPVCDISLYQQYVSALESWHNWLEHLPRFRFACVERSGYE